MTVKIVPNDKGIYARVSTFNGSQTCENQFLELRRYCDARGWVVHAEYTDEMSGAKDRRPGLDRLLLDARRARFNVVVCWALDRIGRDLKHLLAVLEDFQSLNIPFVSLKEGVDLCSASGRLQLAILAALSQFERERLRERTVAGLERARAEGKRLGASLGAGARWEARIRPGHLSARGRQTPWCREINASALAITGPTKPLRSSLTFRLRIPTIQGHLERGRWPQYSVVFWACALDHAWSVGIAFVSQRHSLRRTRRSRNPMAKATPRPESNTSHLAGEYFVAAELYKRGYSVAMTLGNRAAMGIE
jgi:DNA invertase Pin-like site-specific DNA recombinase